MPDLRTVRTFRRPLPFGGCVAQATHAVLFFWGNARIRWAAGNACVALGRHTLRSLPPAVIPAQAGILAEFCNSLFLQELLNSRKDSRLRGNDGIKVLAVPKLRFQTAFCMARPRVWLRQTPYVWLGMNWKGRLKNGFQTASVGLWLVP